MAMLRGVYYTSSWELADDVCRLLLHCGLAFKLSRVDYDPNWKSPFIKTITKVNFPQYRVFTLFKTTRPKANNEYRQARGEYDDKYIDYDGYVDDIKTPHKVFYVRRDGIGILTAGVMRFKTDKALDATKESIQAQSNPTQIVRSTDSVSPTETLIDDDEENTL